MGGAILKTMHQKLAGLTYRPDALMVYVGHNEFQGRYAWMREVDHYLRRRPGAAGRCARSSGLTSFLRFSPLFQLLDETRERQRLDSLPPRSGHPRAGRSSGLHRRRIPGDRRRLSSAGWNRSPSIASRSGRCRSYVIPACNDAGWDPSRSVLAAETPRAERDAFAREVVHARALEAKDPAEARRIYRELVKRHPEFAETHYRLARLLEQTGALG